MLVIALNLGPSYLAAIPLPAPDATVCPVPVSGASVGNCIRGGSYRDSHRNAANDRCATSCACEEAADDETSIYPIPPVFREVVSDCRNHLSAASIPGRLDVTSTEAGPESCVFPLALLPIFLRLNGLPHLFCRCGAIVFLLGSVGGLAVGVVAALGRVGLDALLASWRPGDVTA